MISLKKTIALIITVTALMLISGCVIIPLQRVPNLQGVALRDGKPVAGADVRYIVMECRDDRDKGKVKAKSKTLADGSFTIKGKRRLGFALGLPAEYIICWRLCFQEEGSAPACWYIEASGPPVPPEFIELECDLNAQNVCEVISCSYEYFRNDHKNARDISDENIDQ